MEQQLIYLELVSKYGKKSDATYLKMTNQSGKERRKSKILWLFFLQNALHWKHKLQANIATNGMDEGVRNKMATMIFNHNAELTGINN